MFDYALFYLHVLLIDRLTKTMHAVLFETKPCVLSVFVDCWLLFGRLLGMSLLYMLK